MLDAQDIKVHTLIADVRPGLLRTQIPKRSRPFYCKCVCLARAAPRGRPTRGCRTTAGAHSCAAASASAPQSNSSSSESSPALWARRLRPVAVVSACSESSEQDASTCAGGTQMDGSASSPLDSLGTAASACAGAGSASSLRPMPARTNSDPAARRLLSTAVWRCVQRGSAGAPSCVWNRFPSLWRRTAASFACTSRPVMRQKRRSLHGRKSAEAARARVCAAAACLAYLDGTMCGSYCARQGRT